MKTNKKYDIIFSLFGEARMLWVSNKPGDINSEEHELDLDGDFDLFGGVIDTDKRVDLKNFKPTATITATSGIEALNETQIAMLGNLSEALVDGSRKKIALIDAVNTARTALEAAQATYRKDDSEANKAVVIKANKTLRTAKEEAIKAGVEPKELAKKKEPESPFEGIELSDTDISGQMEQFGKLESLREETEMLLKQVSEMIFELPDPNNITTTEISGLLNEEGRQDLSDVMETLGLIEELPEEVKATMDIEGVVQIKNLDLEELYTSIYHQFPDGKVPARIAGETFAEANGRLHAMFQMYELLMMMANESEAKSIAAHPEMSKTLSKGDIYIADTDADGNLIATHFNKGSDAGEMTIN